MKEAKTTRPRYWLYGGLFFSTVFMAILLRGFPIGQWLLPPIPVFLGMGDAEPPTKLQVFAVFFPTFMVMDAVYFLVGASLGKVFAKLPQWGRNASLVGLIVANVLVVAILSW